MSYLYKIIHYFLLVFFFFPLTIKSSKTLFIFGEYVWRGIGISVAHIKCVQELKKWKTKNSFLICFAQLNLEVVYLERLFFCFFKKKKNTSFNVECFGHCTWLSGLEKVHCLAAQLIGSHQRFSLFKPSSKDMNRWVLLKS